MHCNLRPPDVAPVVLRFNYEAHNAPAYKFNNYTTFADTVHLQIKFQRNRTIRDRFFDNLTNFPNLFSKGRFCPLLFSELGRPTTDQSLALQTNFFRF